MGETAAAGRAHRERDSKIRDERLPVVEENVLRLDVAVNDAVAVSVVERAGYLLGDPHRVADGQLPLAVDARAKRFADDEWHHIVEQGIGLTRIEQRQDVRMLELGGGLYLGKKPLAAERGAEVGMQHFDGDIAVVLEIVTEKNSRHSAGADFPVHFIAAGKRRAKTFGDGRHLDLFFSSSNQLSMTTSLSVIDDPTARIIIKRWSSRETSYC